MLQELELGIAGGSHEHGPPLGRDGFTENPGGHLGRRL
jgi:hypothetical protein